MILLAILLALVGIGIGLGLAWAMGSLRKIAAAPRQLDDRGALIAAARSAPLRVLALGDSFLAWWPIEPTLHNGLGDWAVGRGASLTLAAWGGFGPLEYRQQAEAIIPILEPGLTLVFYYAGNDLTNVQRRPEPVLPPEFRVKLFGPGGVLQASLPAADAPARMRLAWLASAAAQSPPPPESQFDWEAMRAHGTDPELIEFAKNRLREPGRVGPQYVNPWVLQAALGEPGYLVDNLLVERPESLAAFDRIELELAAISNLCRQHDSRLVVVAIPATLQVSASHWEFYRKAGFPMDERLLGTDRPQELLAEACERQGIELLDLLPDFRATAAAGEPLYWENDDHLDESGHRLALRVVRKRVLEPWADSTGVAAGR